MKLAVNIVIAATNQAVAEALALAGSSGVGVDAAYDTLAASAVSSPFLGYMREAYLSAGQAPVSFTTALMSKGLGLALGLAADAGLPLPLTSARASVPGRGMRRGLRGCRLLLRSITAAIRMKKPLGCRRSVTGTSVFRPHAEHVA